MPVLGKVSQPLRMKLTLLNRRDIYDVEVEIMEGISTRAVDARPAVKFPNTPYEVYPSCGSSLGASDDANTAGTLGYYVTIDGKHAGRYILTNDHVAFDKDSCRPGEGGRSPTTA